MAEATKKYRSFKSVPEDYSEKDGKRALRVAFSSETPVLRMGDGIEHKRGEVYYEVLDHDPANANISLLQNGGAFIDEHTWERQIGSIDKAWIDPDKKGRADLSFADTDLGKERWRLMSTGHRKDISFGYITTRTLGESKASDGITVKRFAWEAFEITSTAVGADHFETGVGRNFNPPVDSPKTVDVESIAKNLTAQEKMKLRTLLLDPAVTETAAGGGGAATATVAVDEARVRSNEKAIERSRVKEITKVAEELEKDHPHCREKIRTITNEAISGETTLGDYQIRAMKEVIGAKPAKPVLMADLGMSEDDQRAYSILRGIQSCIKRGKNIPDGLEGDVHAEMEKLSIPGERSGFMVPANAPVRCQPSRRHNRDLQVSVFGQGGATVPTNLVTPIIELLRNRMVTEKLGVIVMGGLTGNVAIPRQTGAATAYSLPESSTLTKSTQVLDQILMAPHRVGAYNDYTKQLLLQSSIDVENFIRDDLMKVIALKWDSLIIYGQGAGSEPQGIVNTPGIGAVLFGAAATFAKLVAFETALAVLNADDGAMAYATSPSVRGTLKSAAKLLTGATTVAAQPLWENAGTPGEGMVNGYRAIASNQIQNNQVIFGNWSDVIHALYGGYDVVVNPYSRDTDAAVRITINTFGDVAVRHAASFAVSSDAGNQ